MPNSANRIYDSSFDDEISALRDVEIKELTYFPTLIYVYKLFSQESMNAHLLETIYREQYLDCEGIKRSNFPDLGGWHSHNRLHKNDKFEKIVGHIHKAGSLIANKNSYDNRYRLSISSMWAIINSPGSFNQSHIHPGSLWSGVYYVQAPKHSGDIELVDPRTQNVMQQPRYLSKTRRPNNCWTKVRFKPDTGKMLLFPSWLYHSVAPNMSSGKERESDRVILSFNLSQKKKETISDSLCRPA